MEAIFEIFCHRFKESDERQLVSMADIAQLEATLEIVLPSDYRSFLMKYGVVWTPGILDIIVDKELELHTLQEFWDMEAIIDDKKNGWTTHLDMDLLPFASDCMGSIFCFATAEIRTQSLTAGIYFYDHDYDEVNKISDSFTAWIDCYNKI